MALVCNLGTGSEHRKNLGGAVGLSVKPQVTATPTVDRSNYTHTHRDTSMYSYTHKLHCKHCQYLRC